MVLVAWLFCFRFDFEDGDGVIVWACILFAAPMDKRNHIAGMVIVNSYCPVRIAEKVCRFDGVTCFHVLSV